MNNGVNENQVKTDTSQPVMVNSNPVTSAAVQSTHPQILASTGEVQAKAIETIASVQATSGEEVKLEEAKPKKEKVKKKPNHLANFFLVIIVLLIAGFVYMMNMNKQQIAMLNEKCTPVSTTKDEKELDLNSNIVKYLYSLVETSLREDLGETELNDSLKLYLAYRQLSHTDIYDSHCKGFIQAGMEPFTCVDSSFYTPKVFKVSDLEVVYKNLFGFDAEMPKANIKLGKSCVGGFQYIESRGEYVQGACDNKTAVMYRVDKELTSAYSKESTIVLRERVKYYGTEGMSLPDRLKSGIYEYTFKLDMNYNYTLISKTFVE